MIDYAKIKPGDKLRITGMGAPGFAKLGDTVTVVSTNGQTRCDVRHDETGDEVFFALTCGAQRLEPVETQSRREAGRDAEGSPGNAGRLLRRRERRQDGHGAGNDPFADLA